MALEIYNSLSRSIEKFEPLHPPEVGFYICGPTVYSKVTIGNWRTYVLGDTIYRSLLLLGYKPHYFMNITDVGHLSGDNLGDADTGEDRLEKASRTEGKNAYEIAKFYTEDFKKGFKDLRLVEPKKFLVATEHIDEQINLVKELLERNLAYQISDGIYFDTIAYEKEGFQYGELSNLDEIKAGARVEMNPEKKNPRDFALWKSSPTNRKRDMEWESPWGVGFPGWHIECSAMSMKYLGSTFDIHAGGEDLKSTHHPNEIAQSQGATGDKPFVKYWIHGSFLQVDGGRMGKSLGNAYTLDDIIARNIPLSALRYLYLGTHYRSTLNFTWEALEGAHSALSRLHEFYLSLPAQKTSFWNRLFTGNKISEKYAGEFRTHIEDDLNMPEALATMWALIKDEVLSFDIKKSTLLYFDQVFGFGIKDWKIESVPEEIQSLAEKRELSRKEKNFAESDRLRDEIIQKGYTLKDTESGPKIQKKF